MDTQKQIICRLCLQICDSFEAIEGDMKQALDVLLPKMDLAAIPQPMICTNCTKRLIKCFDFKRTCLYTHDYILPFVNKDAAKLNLRDLYLSKNENSADVPENQDICGFCMIPVKRCSVIALNVEEIDVIVANMIEQCFPELNLDVIDKPVICVPCYGSLEDCFHFVTNCLIVEEKINDYRETLDINSRDQMELSSLLEYKMRDVTTEEDGNLVDIMEADSKAGINILDEIKEENHNEMEDQKFLLAEEIQIKTDDPDFNSLQDVPTSSQSIEIEAHNYQKVPGFAENNCRSCPTKRKGSLKIHLLSNRELSKVRVHRCEICCYVTKRKFDLKRHMLTHREISEVTAYRCNSCSFVTIAKGGLARHVLTHRELSEAVVYRCSSCSYITKVKKNLKRHMLTHRELSKVTVYRCESCSHVTKRKNDIKRHMLTHQELSEVTVYTCEICLFVTKHKESLKNHMLTHRKLSEVAVYRCEVCSYVTKRNRDLRRHMVIHRELSEVTVRADQRGSNL